MHTSSKNAMQFASSATLLQLGAMEIRPGEFVTTEMVNAAVDAGELRRIQLKDRPTSMPQIPFGEIIVGSLEVGKLTRLFYCPDFDAVTAVYDAYLRGGASTMDWLVAPDPRVVTTVIGPDDDPTKKLNEHFDKVNDQQGPKQDEPAPLDLDL
jgi:hypothetical protein